MFLSLLCRPWADRDVGQSDGAAPHAAQVTVHTQVPH